MKTYATVDLQGNITSAVFFDGPKDAGVGLVPRPGQMMTEIEGLSVENARDIEAVREMLKAHKVQYPFKAIRVSRKT